MTLEFSALHENGSGNSGCNAPVLAPHRKPPVATSADTFGLRISFPPVTTGEAPVDTGGNFFRNSKTDFVNPNHALKHGSQ